jgi:Ca2+-binding RTX toxin-like protein
MTSWGLWGAVPAQAGPTTPPFTQCPAIGADTSCAILIVFNADGSTTILQDPSQGPYDRIEDTLVGVQNNSGSPVTSTQLSSSKDIFGFDADGLCTSTPRPASCPFGSTGYEGPNTSFTVVNAFGTAGNDVIFGLGGNDRIDGNGGNDTICGGAGDDRLNGNGGNDTIYGDTGNDSLFGNEDNDILFGGPGNDFLAGSTGDDQLNGGSGYDTLSGDAGTDKLSDKDGTGGDRLDGGLGTDTCIADPNDGLNNCP